MPRRQELCPLRKQARWNRVKDKQLVAVTEIPLGVSVFRVELQGFPYWRSANNHTPMCLNCESESYPETPATLGMCPLDLREAPTRDVVTPRSMRRIAVLAIASIKHIFERHPQVCWNAIDARAIDRTRTVEVHNVRLVVD